MDTLVRGVGWEAVRHGVVRAGRVGELHWVATPEAGLGARRRRLINRPG